MPENLSSSGMANNDVDHDLLLNSLHQVSSSIAVLGKDVGHPPLHHLLSSSNRTIKRRATSRISTVAVLTCKGDINDPNFPHQLKCLVKAIQDVLPNGSRRNIKVMKVEPWNSVRVTFNIPREAALRLRQLAQQGDHALRDLGILSVQIEGDQVISLTIAGQYNEPQEILLRSSDDSNMPSTSGFGDRLSSAFDVPGAEESPGPSNVEATRKNITEYLSQQKVVGGSPVIKSTSVNSSLLRTGSISSHAFKSPNVVAPTNEPIPFPPSTSSSIRVSTPSVSHINVNSSTNSNVLGPPFPFASMTHAMTTMQGFNQLQQSSSTSSCSPFTIPPPSVGLSNVDSANVSTVSSLGSDSRQSVVSQPSLVRSSVQQSTDLKPETKRSVKLSSPLLVNLLQSDGRESGSSSPSLPLFSQPNVMLPPPPPDNSLSPTRKKRRPRKPKDKPEDSMAVKTDSTLAHLHSHLNNIQKNVVVQHVQQLIKDSSASRLNVSNTCLTSSNVLKINDSDFNIETKPESGSALQRHPRPNNVLPSRVVKSESNIVQNQTLIKASSPCPSSHKKEEVEQFDSHRETSSSSSKTQHLINPFTGQLEPMEEDDDEMNVESKEDACSEKNEETSDVLGSPSELKLEQQRDHASGVTANQPQSSGQIERLKLKLKFDSKVVSKDVKCEDRRNVKPDLGHPYKVDVSYSSSATVKCRSNQDTVSLPNQVSEPRVPPLHISLKGRSATVVVKDSSEKISPSHESISVSTKSDKIKSTRTNRSPDVISSIASSPVNTPVTNLKRIKCDGSKKDQIKEKREQKLLSGGNVLHFRQVNSVRTVKSDLGERALSSSLPDAEESGKRLTSRLPSADDVPAAMNSLNEQSKEFRGLRNETRKRDKSPSKLLRLSQESSNDVSVVNCNDTLMANNTSGNGSAVSCENHIDSGSDPLETEQAEKHTQETNKLPKNKGEACKNFETVESSNDLNTFSVGQVAYNRNELHQSSPKLVSDSTVITNSHRVVDSTTTSTCNTSSNCINAKTNSHSTIVNNSTSFGGNNKSPPSNSIDVNGDDGGDFDDYNKKRIHTEVNILQMKQKVSSSLAGIVSIGVVSSVGSESSVEFSSNHDSVFANNVGVIPSLISTHNATSTISWSNVRDQNTSSILNLNKSPALPCASVSAESVPSERSSNSIESRTSNGVCDPAADDKTVITNSECRLGSATESSKSSSIINEVSVSIPSEDSSLDSVDSAEINSEESTVKTQLRNVCTKKSPNDDRIGQSIFSISSDVPLDAVNFNEHVDSQIISTSLNSESNSILSPSGEANIADDDGVPSLKQPSPVMHHEFVNVITGEDVNEADSMMDSLSRVDASAIKESEMVASGKMLELGRKSNTDLSLSVGNQAVTDVDLEVSNIFAGGSKKSTDEGSGAVKSDEAGSNVEKNETVDGNDPSSKERSSERLTVGASSELNSDGVDGKNKKHETSLPMFFKLTRRPVDPSDIADRSTNLNSGTSTSLVLSPIKGLSMSKGSLSSSQIQSSNMQMPISPNSKTVPIKVVTLPSASSGSLNNASAHFVELSLDQSQLCSSSSVKCTTVPKSVYVNAQNCPVRVVVASKVSPVVPGAASSTSSYVPISGLTTMVVKSVIRTNSTEAAMVRSSASCTAVKLVSSAASSVTPSVQLNESCSSCVSSSESCNKADSNLLETDRIVNDGEKLVRNGLKVSKCPSDSLQSEASPSLKNDEPVAFKYDGDEKLQASKIKEIRVDELRTLTEESKSELGGKHTAVDEAFDAKSESSRNKTSTLINHVAVNHNEVTVAASVPEVFSDKCEVDVEHSSENPVKVERSDPTESESRRLDRKVLDDQKQFEAVAPNVDHNYVNFSIPDESNENDDKKRQTRSQANSNKASITAIKVGDESKSIEDKEEQLGSVDKQTTECEVLPDGIIDQANREQIIFEENFEMLAKYYSKPLKRKCSENAAELIKACMGVEEVPKRAAAQAANLALMCKTQESNKADEKSTKDDEKNAKKVNKKDDSTRKSRDSTSDEDVPGTGGESTSRNRPSTKTRSSNSTSMNDTRASRNRIQQLEDHRANSTSPSSSRGRSCREDSRMRRAKDKTNKVHETSPTLSRLNKNGNRVADEDNRLSNKRKTRSSSCSTTNHPTAETVEQPVAKRRRR